MLGLNLLIKPIWILTENVVQDQLGHETFGLFSALFSLVLVLSVFSDLGINHFITNSVAKDTSLYKQTLSVFFSARVGVVVAFPLLCVAVGYLFGYRDEHLWYLGLIAVGQALLQFVFLFRAKFQAFQSFITDSVASVLDKILLIVFVLGLIFFSTISLENFIYSRLWSVLIVAVVLLIVVVVKYGGFSLSFSFTKMKDALIKTLPFTLMTMLYAVNERIDMFMVERLHSSQEAGLYAGAYRWYDAFMMFIWLLMPMFFAKFSSKQQEHISILKSGKLLVAIPIILLSGLVLANNQFLFFLFKQSSVQEISSMSSVLSVLTISFLFNGLFVLYGTYLNAAGYVSKVNWLVALSVVVNIALNIIFIPKYGAIASAYTTALSTVILSVGYFIMIKSKVEIDKKILFKLFSLSIIFCILCVVLSQFIQLPTIVYLVFGVLIFILLLFVFKLFTPFIVAIKGK
jgi:O-antigen/teichoic acid export membrane protein